MNSICSNVEDSHHRVVARPTLPGQGGRLIKWPLKQLSAGKYPWRVAVCVCVCMYVYVLCVVVVVEVVVGNSVYFTVRLWKIRSYFVM